MEIHVLPRWTTHGLNVQGSQGQCRGNSQAPSTGDVPPWKLADSHLLPPSFHGLGTRASCPHHFPLGSAPPWSPVTGTRDPTTSFLSPCCFTRISGDLIQGIEIDMSGGERKQEITGQNDTDDDRGRCDSSQERTSCEESGWFAGPWESEA